MATRSPHSPRRCRASVHSWLGTNRGRAAWRTVAAQARGTVATIPAGTVARNRRCDGSHARDGGSLSADANGRRDVPAGAYGRRPRLPATQSSQTPNVFIWSARSVLRTSESTCCAVCRGSDRSSVREAPRHRRRDRRVEAKLPQVGPAELVRAGVVVGSVVGRFLVADQVRDALHHEVVVVGAHDRQRSMGVNGPSPATGVERPSERREQVRPPAGEEPGDPPGADVVGRRHDVWSSSSRGPGCSRRSRCRPCSSPFHRANGWSAPGARPSRWICRAMSSTIIAFAPLSSAPVPRSQESRCAPMSTISSGLERPADLADHVVALVRRAGLHVEHGREREPLARAQQPERAGGRVALHHHHRVGRRQAERRVVPGEQIVRPGRHVDQARRARRERPTLDPDRLVVFPEEPIDVVQLFRLDQHESALCRGAQTREVRLGPRARRPPVGAVRPAAGVPVENGSAAIRGRNWTPSPCTVAVAERSSQSPGIVNGSLPHRDAGLPEPSDGPVDGLQVGRRAGRPAADLVGEGLADRWTSGVSPSRAPTRRRGAVGPGRRQRSAREEREQQRVPGTMGGRGRRVTVDSAMWRGKRASGSTRRSGRSRSGRRAACCRWPARGSRPPRAGP